MGTCFVIQPFDQGRFDKRYEDTFKPAIESAGLEPYRVDQDPHSAVPIRDIENGIRQADACFAEISEDNPNVWFELGFAIATRKPVIMVCAETRSRFPFDVQHRHIIRYQTDSPSDFRALGESITERLKAALRRQQELEDISDISTVADQEGLSQHEVAALVAAASYSAVPDDPPSYWMLQRDMNNAGYTDIAVALATRALVRKGLVENTSGYDERSRDEYTAVHVTERGMGWLEANQERLVLRQEKEPGAMIEADDDLPF